jgi:sigma-B regulation protein RsbU (phosphoserine phosphatase)
LLDVTGHGVPAALLSVAVSRTLLPSLDETCLVTKSEASAGGVSLQVTAPIEVVDRLNRRFAKERESGRLFTILYGILDGGTGQLRYASAGHPGPVHLPARGDATLLPGVGFPIGLVHPDEPGYGYQEYSVPLQPQDRVYLYSDGIVDAQDSHGEPFGEQRWLKLLESTRGQALAESVQTVKTALEAWCGAAPLVDDLSLLAVEYSPG